MKHPQWAIEQHIKKNPKCEWLCMHDSIVNLGEEESMTTQNNQLIQKIEQCFLKNNMCDCGEEHTNLSMDEIEYFDTEAVVRDLAQLVESEALALLDRLEKKKLTISADQKGIPFEYEGEPVKLGVVPLEAIEAERSKYAGE